MLSMVSAVQMPVTQIMPVLITSITLSRSPRWKCLRRRKHSGHLAPRMNQSTPRDVSGEVTGDSFFMVEEEPAQQLGFREHIVGGLAAMTRALAMVVILHYLSLSFGNSLYS